MPSRGKDVPSTDSEVKFLQQCSEQHWPHKQPFWRLQLYMKRILKMLLYIFHQARTSSNYHVLPTGIFRCCSKQSVSNMLCYWDIDYPTFSMCTVYQWSECRVKVSCHKHQKRMHLVEFLEFLHLNANRYIWWDREMMRDCFDFEMYECCNCNLNTNYGCYTTMASLILTWLIAVGF